jgi:NTE family protein
VEKVRLDLRTTPRAADSPFASDADIYFINVSLNKVVDADERWSLMKIPTTLYLTDQQIDQLLLAASRLICNNPDFQRLMRDLEQSQ